MECLKKLKRRKTKRLQNNVVAILANTYIDLANGQTGRKDGGVLCIEKRNSFVNLKAF